MINNYRFFIKYLILKSNFNNFKKLRNENKEYGNIYIK